MGRKLRLIKHGLRTTGEYAKGINGVLQSDRAQSIRRNASSFIGAGDLGIYSQLKRPRYVRHQKRKRQRQYSDYLF